MFRRALPLCLALLHGSHALQLAPRAAAAATVLRGGTPRCSAQRGLTSFDAEETAKRVQRCLAVKEASGLSFDELADELGLTNTYTCQLLLGQAQLKPDTAPKLQALLPGLSEADLTAMQAAPMRGFDEEILKEPNVYRTYEAITHYGQAQKTPTPNPKPNPNPNPNPNRDPNPNPNPNRDPNPNPNPVR